MGEMADGCTAFSEGRYGHWKQNAAIAFCVAYRLRGGTFALSLHSKVDPIPECAEKL
jgi:hypothetical protein